MYVLITNVLKFNDLIKNMCDVHLCDKNNNKIWLNMWLELNDICLMKALMVLGWS